MYDVLNLFLGRHKFIRSKTIRSFERIDEFLKIAEATEDLPLLGFINIVTKYGRDLLYLMRILKSRVVDEKTKRDLWSANEADMIFSTVHKAKGMEYDEVTLLNDFSCGKERLIQLTAKTVGDRKFSENKRAFYNEEINLLYVAATRARVILNIPKSVAPRNYKGAKGINIMEQEYRS